MLLAGGSSAPPRPMIEITCPKCRSELSFGDGAAGRIVRCPACRVRLRLRGELTAADRPRQKKPRRQESDDVGEAPDWLAPTVILVLGLALTVGSLALARGQGGAEIGLLVVAGRVFTAVPLSIAGMFVVAPLLGISFGTIGLAILKLAAINVTALAIVMNVQFAGGHAFFGYLIATPVMWGMFKWMFELDFNETMISVTVIDLIQFLATLTVTAAMLRAGK
jgi:hypothetical protein